MDTDEHGSRREEIGVGTPLRSVRGAGEARKAGETGDGRECGRRMNIMTDGSESRPYRRLSAESGPGSGFSLNPCLSVSIRGLQMPGFGSGDLGVAILPKMGKKSGAPYTPIRCAFAFLVTPKLPAKRGEVLLNDKRNRLLSGSVNSKFSKSLTFIAIGSN